MNRDSDRTGGQAGNVALFDSLYHEHHRVLHAYLAGQCSNPETSIDLLQETFIRVWRNIEEVNQIPRSEQRFFLFTIARNLLHDLRRRDKVRQHLQQPLPDIIEEKADSNSDPAIIFSAKETQSAVDGAIRRLPVDLRTVLTLHLLGEMNSNEIGAALGIPAGTVRYRISQARQQIAQDLGLVKGKSIQQETKVNERTKQ